jgi:outer membrane lipase/esterase
MRKCTWILILAASLGLSSMAAQAAAPTYSALYVFGDSYCDVGNLYLATGGLEAAPPYYNMRFSNGPLWIDHVAGFLGLPMKPYLLGGTNFAFGGAWVTQPQSVTGVPSVPQQVEIYLSLSGGKADPNALYILEGGGNDILDTTSGSPQVLGGEIAAGIVQSEHLLRVAGARNFVIPNLFNVGLLPAGEANAAFGAAASAAANKVVNQLLASEESLPKVHIIRLNVFSLLNSVEKDPAHFGFTNVTDPCYTTVVCADPDHSLFWDVHHPTEFGHAFFAVTLENALDQED